MISDFGNTTSAPDLIKPLYRLPLPGDYLSEAHLVSLPLQSPLGKLKHLILVMNLTDADNCSPRFSPNVSAIAIPTRISVTEHRLLLGYVAIANSW